jgi:hypothetical protein
MKPKVCRIKLYHKAAKVFQLIGSSNIFIITYFQFFWLLEEICDIFYSIPHVKIYNKQSRDSSSTNRKDRNFYFYICDTWLIKIVIYSKSEEGKAFIHANCVSERKRPYSRLLYLVLFDTSLEVGQICCYGKK